MPSGWQSGQGIGEIVQGVAEQGDRAGGHHYYGLQRGGDGAAI
jgi:hypothetical protein